MTQRREPVVSRARFVASVLAVVALAYLSLATTALTCGQSVATDLELAFEADQDTLTLRIHRESTAVLLEHDEDLILSAHPVAVDTAQPAAPLPRARLGNFGEGRRVTWLVCDTTPSSTSGIQLSEAGDSSDFPVLQAGPSCEVLLSRDGVGGERTTVLTTFAVSDQCNPPEAYGVRVEVVP